ncbi:MAG: hypothetical protein KF791_12990 [Verrucomicrobiae bacterium]|nr:hypothetical protein [Verrucomicrobiae bacterium]
MIGRDNVLLAVRRALRGRRLRPEVIRYLEGFEDEMEWLREQLMTGAADCGDCHEFRIFDPKERWITAPVFRERVLHHAAMNVCGPVLDRRLTSHTYACRMGLGTFAAVEAACRAAGRQPWFLKLDVRKYFDSVPHHRLESFLDRVFRERQAVRLLINLVKAYRQGSNYGLAIGTLVSQHLANFYLTALDTLVLQEIRPGGYVRYMDDMALWFGTRDAALSARDRIIRFATAPLELTFKTVAIQRSNQGMDFLGHRIHPHWAGLGRRSRRRYSRNIRRLHTAWLAGEVCEREAQDRGTALGAFIGHARCLEWRRRVVRDLGDGPQAGTARCAAAAGTTTARTPRPATATATRPATGTTTSASGPAPAPAECGDAPMEQARLPAPGPPGLDKTHAPRRRLVAERPTARSAKAGAGDHPKEAE